MSKCALHMMKMKMSAMGGIQSHNQREHESRKNKDIDYSKSDQNFELINYGSINYQTEVKQRISELNLKKAVRKDAVTYCSFIVSSDNLFFKRLADAEHYRRSCMESESIAIGLMEPTPIEYMPDSYQEDCYQEGCRLFFEDATTFFCNRYGIENVINATVHMDEATPHMHLGIVPVTEDGRLSAKDIFTRVELTNLQTAFAQEVGKKYGLERGIEGSTATHLSEERFKLKKAQENMQKAVEDAQNAQNALLKLKWDISTLKGQKEALGSEIQALQDEKQIIEQAVKEKMTLGERQFGMDGIKERIAERKNEMEKANRLSLLEQFIALPQVSPIFEKFCQMLQKSKKQNQNKNTESPNR